MCAAERFSGVTRGGPAGVTHCLADVSAPRCSGRAQSILSWLPFVADRGVCSVKGGIERLAGEDGLQGSQERHPLRAHRGQVAAANNVAKSARQVEWTLQIPRAARRHNQRHHDHFAPGQWELPGTSARRDQGGSDGTPGA
jgi:hypothetical protein